MLNQTSKYYRRFFLPFLIIIIIMTIFTFTSFHYTQKNAENQSVKSTLTYLNHTANLLENHFLDLTQFMNELDTSNNLSHTARNPDLTLLDVKDLVRQLYVSKNSLPLADNIIVYFKNSNIVVDCNSAFYFKNKEQYIYSNAMNFEDFNSVYLHTKYYNTFVKLEHLVYFGKTYEDTYTFLTSFPIASENSEVQVVVIIDREKLLGLITPTQNSLDVSINILDDNGFSLTDTTKHLHEAASKVNNYEIQRINGKKYILYSSQLNSTPLKLTAYVPYNKAVHPATSQKLVIYIMLIIGSSLCIWYSRKIAKSHKNQFYNILETNLVQNKKLKEYTPHIKEDFLKKVLLGEISSEESSLKIEEYVPPSAMYCILRIRINTDTIHEIYFAKELSLKKFIIRNVLDEIYPESIYVNIGINEICFILYADSDKDEFSKNLDNIENVIKTVLEDTINYELDYAFGTIVHSQDELTTSFFEAYNSKIIEQIQNMKSIQNDGSAFFPIELENALIDAVKHSSLQTIHALFDTIIATNPDPRNDVYVYLRVCLARAASEINAKAEIELSSIEEYKAAFISLSQQTVQNNSSLLNNILDYINNNFSDPQLSRKLISDKFGISDAYISKLFKNHLGTTFLNYTEKVRIEQACKYIRTSPTWSIEKIAKECGYLNLPAFRRAFKKLTGVPPSQYK